MRLRLVVVPALLALVAGCASHQPAADLAHPAGHADVVLRQTEGPGMGTMQTFFTEPAVLVLTGDGTVYLRGDEATTQGIVWPIFGFRAHEPDVQTLLHEADHEELLAPPPDYTPPGSIADAGDTTLEVDAGGGTWSHRANGLGAFRDETGSRQRLADFVDFLDHWARDPGSARAHEIQPTVLRVLAQPVAGGSSPSAEPVGRWPTDAAVDLAALGDCTVVRDPRVVHRLTTSTTRYYRQAGQTFEVAAAVLLPGDSCAADSAS